MGEEGSGGGGGEERKGIRQMGGEGREREEERR